MVHIQTKFVLFAWKKCVSPAQWSEQNQDLKHQNRVGVSV